MKTLFKVCSVVCVLWTMFLMFLNIDVEAIARDKKISFYWREKIWFLTSDKNKYNYLVDEYLDDIQDYLKIKNKLTKEDVVLYSEESTRLGFTNKNLVFVNTYYLDNSITPIQDFCLILSHELTHIKQHESATREYIHYNGNNYDEYVNSPDEKEARIMSNMYINQKFKGGK